MKEEKQRIIRKRVPVHGGGGGHAGGAWKLAYADFMTAMMALFLALYLINQATPQQRKGIAEHFRMPLRVALEGGAKSSDSSSVIPGGGADPTQRDGEIKQADADTDSDAQALEEMKDKLNDLIQNNPVFQQFKSQLLVDITTEGLRLQIVDSDKRPMFELASAVVEPHMRAILRALAPMLNSWPNRLTLAGHTDAHVYSTGLKSYSNWELSADRANASRRELVAGGLTDNKVMRVMGLSDSMNLDKNDPLDPINRRISIVVLNARTQRQIERENSGEGAKRQTVALPTVAQAPQPTPPAEPLKLPQAIAEAPAR